MKTNNLKSLIGAAAFCATLAVPHLASAAVTPPVGYVKLELAPEADTPFSLPMNRPMVYSGLASGVSGNVISIANSDFTASEFVYADGIQNEKYYVLFKTGSLEGRKFDVIVNSANTITVDPDRDEDNTAIETDLATLLNNASATDTFEIRPHWTLATAFSDVSSIPVATSLTDVDGSVLLREIQTGINIPTSEEYVYFDSTVDSFDGWYTRTGIGGARQDDVVLTSTEFHVFRNNTTDDYTFNVVGDVPTTDITNNIKVHVVDNDNYKTVSFPIELTLSQSDLVGSGAFQASEDFNLREGDSLLTFEYPSTEFNPPTSIEYIYFDSTVDSFDGWYIAGDFASGIQNDEIVFQPGRAYIIRTAERNSEENLFWSTPLPYDPLVETN